VIAVFDAQYLPYNEKDLCHSRPPVGEIEIEFADGKFAREVNTCCEDTND
jgi:hypothetical protein